MKILFATRGDGADSFFRATGPASVLKYQGYDVEARPPVLGEDYLTFDVMIMQRHVSAIACLVMAEFQAAGKPVIYDTDDWLFGLPPSWPSYRDYFQLGSGEPRAPLEYHKRCLVSADLVTCPTPELANRLSSYNENVLFVPNCVLMADWDTLIPSEKEMDGPLIGWFGTHNHWDNWRQIVHAIDLAVYDTDGYLAILGYPEVVHCFPERLAARTMVQPRVPWSSFGQFRRLISTFDVGLAWVEDTPFNRCKSPLKALQYGAAGVPIVASETVYGEFWRDLYPHVPSYSTCKSPADVYDAVLDTLDNLEAARAQAHWWQQTVWERHSYETQAEEWLEVIKEALSD